MWVWRAWHALRHDRPWITEMTVVPSPAGPIPVSAARPRRIPFSSIDAYARRYGITGERFDFLLRLLHQMEDAFMEHFLKRSGQGGAGAGNGNLQPKH